jgi:hypothetical protein
VALCVPIPNNLIIFLTLDGRGIIGDGLGETAAGEIERNG